MNFGITLGPTDCIEKEVSALNPILKEIIWLIVKLVLEGMSRENAIATVAKERGLDAEELSRLLLK